VIAEDGESLRGDGTRCNYGDCAGEAPEIVHVGSSAITLAKRVKVVVSRRFEARRAPRLLRRLRWHLDHGGNRAPKLGCLWQPTRPQFTHVEEGVMG